MILKYVYTKDKNPKVLCYLYNRVFGQSTQYMDQMVVRSVDYTVITDIQNWI